MSKKRVKKTTTTIITEEETINTVKHQHKNLKEKKRPGKVVTDNHENSSNERENVAGNIYNFTADGERMGNVSSTLINIPKYYRNISSSDTLIDKFGVKEDE